MSKTKQVPIQTDPVKALEDAQQALYELRLRIADGDPNVTPDDLETAERVVRFAQVRVDHAAEAEQRRIDEHRATWVVEIRASLPDVFDTTRLDAPYQALIDALDTYCKEAQVIQSGVSEIYNELIRMPSPGISVETSAYTGVTIDGHRVPNFSHQITEVVRDAFRRHGLRLEEGGR
jgi:predicted RNA methylase